MDERTKNKNKAESLFNAIEQLAEKELAKNAWAKTWKEFEEKYPDEYPDDRLTTSLKEARQFRVSLRKARAACDIDPYETACETIHCMTSFFLFSRESFAQLTKKQLSDKANATKKQKQENLYTEAMALACTLANENTSWNNVQIADEIKNDETFIALSLRVLKERILLVFPSRNHRQKRK